MKLLFVDCCISQRGAASRTRRLAEAYLSAFRQTRPDWTVETVDLSALDLRPFDAAALDARDALIDAGSFDGPAFAPARQFREADAVLVAAPYWDMSYPAALRIYLEHICVRGLTYHYDSAGSHGDCRARKLVYLTSGGDLEQEDSLGAMHWRQLCGLFGIGQFDDVFAGGLDLGDGRETERLEAACALARRLASEL